MRALAVFGSEIILKTLTFPMIAYSASDLRVQKN
jgi:hypothetical protein